MTQLNPETAVAILKKYNCTSQEVLFTPGETEQLQAAILLIASLSDYQNLGICAANLTRAWTALNSYLAALGYPTQLQPTQEIDDSPIYLKFNTQKLNYYLDTYEGIYRGVLIAYQGEDLEIMGTYGYFPLDLWDML